jgi:hypothetical protein
MQGNRGRIEGKLCFLSAAVPVVGLSETLSSPSLGWVEGQSECSAELLAARGWLEYSERALRSAVFRMAE